jgi:UDP-glucose 4-epimerase
VITVTGASGFLGKALVEVLCARDIATQAIARRPVSVPRGGSSLCVRSYDETPEGTLLIHLAEERSIVGAEAAGERYRNGNAAVLAKLLARFDRVVYASSAAVYGDNKTHRRKSTEAVEPAGIYAQAKCAAEEQVLQAGGTVARLSNLYGAGMAPDTIIAEIVAQIPGSAPLTVRDGKPVRDFLWVDDAAAGMADLAQSALGGVFNLGTGIGTSIAAVARTALALTGQDARPVIETRPSHRASCLILDAEDTRAATGWAARTNLDEGLSRLLQGVR